MHASLIVQVQSDYPKIIQEVILVQTTNLAKTPHTITLIIFVANSGCLKEGASSLFFQS